MKQSLIKEIQQEMAGVVNNAQRQKLDEVLEHCFFMWKKFLWIKSLCHKQKIIQL